MRKHIGLIVSILIIQLVAILGAVLTSRASAKFGNIKTLIVVNSIWMLICVYAYFMETPLQFYIVAAVSWFGNGRCSIFSTIYVF